MSTTVVGNHAILSDWDQIGVTVCDPDGFRVVLVGRTWP
jgi:hypothetical protein